MRNFNDLRRWPGYAQARTSAGLDDFKVMQWFGCSQEIIDDWHANGAPVPVHILFRYMADKEKRLNGHQCHQCQVLEVLRPHPANPPSQVVVFPTIRAERSEGHRARPGDS